MGCPSSRIPLVADFNDIRRRRIRWAAMLGLAGCLALTLGSVLSYFVAPAYIAGGRMHLFIGGGILSQPCPANLPSGLRVMDADIPPKSISDRIRGWFMSPQRMGGGWWFIPLGPPVAVAAAVCWFIHSKARPRVPKGHCPNCGYDLTGADHVVCPECGHASGGV